MIMWNQGPWCEKCHGPMILFLNPARYICPARSCRQQPAVFAEWLDWQPALDLTSDAAVVTA